MFDFKNKKVIVTGATGGIGDAILNRFVDQEAKVLATGTNIEKLKLLKDKHNNIFTSRFDILNHEEIEKFVERSSEILEGGPDILINNAGITRDNLSLRMSYNEWKEVIDINLNSTFLLCKFSLKKMIKNKYGKIVNITSVVGHTGNVGQANYAASKSGIIGLSKSLALEYAKKNININCVSPGFIETKMTDKIDQKFKDIIISKIPSNRLGTPDDVANVTAFLSSDLANYITGETIHVNGGMYLGWQNFYFIYSEKNKGFNMSEDVSSKVKKIVADHLGIDEGKVTDESSFIDDLGADSLDTVELVMAFEEEFGSEISDSEAEKILTVGDAIKFIESKSN